MQVDFVFNQSVRMTGVEPACLTAPDPKSGTSANFATSACKTLNLMQTQKTSGSVKIRDLVKTLVSLYVVAKNEDR